MHVRYTKNEVMAIRALHLPHGTVELPAFFPDGTRGIVKCVDPRDLTEAGIPGLVMNTYHLMLKPGQTTLKAMGGLHGFMGWQRPILTDSGGFQVFSLIRENAKFGEIRANEIIFRTGDDGKKMRLTPEKCIQSQFAFGADILMCLDYCTHPTDSYEINRQAVETTIRWAKRCKEEYLRQLDARGLRDAERPLLFGIIQGGQYPDLRRACAEALIAIGFDGFGFGGWPLDEQGRLMEDMLRQTADLMPGDTPKYAMGLGTPKGIVACHGMGYNLFDCVIPTREARHNRLYVWDERYDALADIDVHAEGCYHHLYIKDDTYWRDGRPVSALCDCHCCRNFSRAYLRHIYMLGDPLAYRLATIHNLRFYSQLMERLREGG